MTTFDVVDFYPSITETLLRKAVNFAKRHIDISQENIELIFHCRKTLLYHGETPWIKKKNGGRFDVSMGSYDGAEVCEIVGLFLLDILSHRYEKKDMGLYRDDGLAVFKNHNGHQNDRVRKDLISFFKHHGLDLVINTNLKRVDYLDISFDLDNGLYKPFIKPNNDPLYIHAESNHPPSIREQIPKSVSKRLSSHSANEEVFNEAAPIYNRALEKSGYSEKVSFSAPTLRNTRRNRARNVLWYNPPYSKNVETNVARTFLYLVGKHFPVGHRYRKIFNKNNLKVSYGCMDNIDRIIKSHNAKIGRPVEQPEPCNCQASRTCPLDGNCRVSNVIYQAEVYTNDQQPPKVYIGLCENCIKERISNHYKAFNDEQRRYVKDTALSEYIWELKDSGVTDYIHKMVYPQEDPQIQ